MRIGLGAFNGHIAVVTGASTGIGAAIALALAKEGADLYLVARRLESLERVAQDARDLGATATCCAADFSSEIGQREFIQRITTDLRYVDILIQDAGIYVSGSVESASLEDLDLHYRVNVRAPFALAKALIPMLKNRHGQVVFINSSHGITAHAYSSEYDSTKHALKAIADSLRGEVNAAGVRVLSVYLGRTATDMQARIYAQEGKQYQPGLLLQTEDVASTVLNALTLSRTAEVTDIHIRPMIKS